MIYIIRENRSYDQVLRRYRQERRRQQGRRRTDPSRYLEPGERLVHKRDRAQDITPNAHALAMRFGLLDRFFVNAEASPDGHNWSTAAFSNDYIDKAFRWNYSHRGRTYDYEGFNRLPALDPPANQPPVAMPPVFDLPATGRRCCEFLETIRSVSARRTRHR